MNPVTIPPSVHPRSSADLRRVFETISLGLRPTVIAACPETLRFDVEIALALAAAERWTLHIIDVDSEDWHLLAVARLEKPDSLFVIRGITASNVERAMGTLNVLRDQLQKLCDGIWIWWPLLHPGFDLYAVDLMSDRSAFLHILPALPDIEIELPGPVVWKPSPIQEPDVEPPSNVESGPMELEPLRWLHITDLHAGQPGSALHDLAWFDLEDLLKKEVALFGNPHLIIVTGDLANRGTANEFQQFDSKLDQLVKVVGARAVLVVPGNHDLQRPPDLDRYRAEVLDPRAPYEVVQTEVGALFANYLEWFDRRFASLPDGITLERPAEALPGDIIATVHFPGVVRMTVAGLNSAWSHVSDIGVGDVLLRVEQVVMARRALRESAPSVGFILMHHPPDWLDAESRVNLRQAWAGDGYRALLCGHVHEARSTGEIHGIDSRAHFAGYSTLGLENYGRSGATRTQGVAFGRFHASGQVDLRVFDLLPSQGDRRYFALNRSYHPRGAAGLEETEWHRLLPPRE